MPSKSAHLKILLVDGENEYWKNLLARIQENPDMLCIGRLTVPEKVLDYPRLNECDVVIADISEPNGDSKMATVIELLNKHQDVKLLVIDRLVEEDDLTDMILAGARGFVLKSTGHDELMRAIRTVNSGDVYYSSSVLKMISHLFQSIGGRSAIKQSIRDHDLLKDLSKREIEVLRLIVKGYTTDKIAEELFISSHTVISHRRKLFSKLKVNKVTDLVRMVASSGIV